MCVCRCVQQVKDVASHWDAMAKLVRERVNWVMSNVPPSVRGWNVLAAFIVKRSRCQHYMPCLILTITCVCCF